MARRGMFNQVRSVLIDDLRPPPPRFRTILRKGEDTELEQRLSAAAIVVGLRQHPVTGNPASM